MYKLLISMSLVTLFGVSAFSDDYMDAAKAVKAAGLKNYNCTIHIPEQSGALPELEAFSILASSKKDALTICLNKIDGAITTHDDGTTEVFGWRTQRHPNGPAIKIDRIIVTE